MIQKTMLACAAGGVMALMLAGTVHAQAATPRATTPKAADTSVPPEANAIFAAWDSDKSGTLSLSEFQNGWMMLRRAGEMQARLHEQFNALDTNHNDAIDASEYSNLVLVKRAGTSAQPLSAFDANKDQRLEFGEYIELVQRMAPSRPAAVAPKKSP